MVKAVDINRDISKIAEKVGTTVFSYDEIHNAGIANKFHYDYQKVIEVMSRRNGRDMTEELIERGVLLPLPNGEYRVEVGACTKNGGGKNYTGLVSFSFSSRSYWIKYHELAHSLQKCYGLFSQKTMKMIYKKAEEQLGGKEKAKGKFVSMGDYYNYVKEMHSESFAGAALMLRAKNPFDFACQVLKAYAWGVHSNLNALYEFKQPVYGNSVKYYTSYSVMKETIKQVFKIRISKNQKAFFDENGVLKDEKLAKLCEQIVLKSAYTPRTLNTLFRNKFFSKTSLHENGWRRDMVKSIIAAPASFVMMKDIPYLYWQYFKHRRLEKEENKEIGRFLNSKYQGTDEELVALHRYSQLKFKERSLFGEEIPELQEFMLNVMKNDDYEIDAMTNFMQSELGIAPKASRFFLLEFKQAAQEYKTSPYFVALWKKNVSLKNAFKLGKMKLENPTWRVFRVKKVKADKIIHSIFSEDSKAERKQKEELIKNNAAWHKISGMLEMIAQIADKYDKSGALKENLQVEYLKGEDKMLSLEFWENIVQQYGTESLRRREMCVKDMCVLGSKLGADIKKNRNNVPYSVVKKFLIQDKEDKKAKRHQKTKVMTLKHLKEAKKAR